MKTLNSKNKCTYTIKTVVYFEIINVPDHLVDFLFIIILELFD